LEQTKEDGGWGTRKIGRNQGSREMGMRQPTYRPDGGDARPDSHVAAAALVVEEVQHAVLVAEEEGGKIG
jgi:hypothetical protein